MALTTYRIFQLPNFSGTDWETIGPPLQAGTDKLFSVLSHTWNITVKPNNIGFSQGWVTVRLSDRLPLDLEQHLEITPL
jgi:hypothetical protein